MTASDITARRHSRPGIASVAIGLSVPVLLIFLLVLSILLGSKNGSAGNYLAMGFVGFGLTAPFLHLAGTILGLVGLVSNKTKNLFPVAGTVLNIVLGVSGILIIYLIVTNITWGFR